MKKKNQPKIFNLKNSKGQRKYLRNNMTKAEIILWSKLKAKQVHGYKFRRQHGIGNYIVDFYCPELELVIEVDGESHYTANGRWHDRKRTSYFKSLNLNIHRFTNVQIKENVEGVVTEISAIIQKLKPQS